MEALYSRQSGLTGLGLEVLYGTFMTYISFHVIEILGSDILFGNTRLTYDKIIIDQNNP